MKSTHSKYFAAFGLLLLIGQIIYFDFNQVVESLTNADIEYLVLSWLCILLSSLLSSFNAWLLIARPNKITFRNFFGLYWIAWAFSLVVPGQIGDTATYFIQLKKQSISTAKILAGSITDKFTSILIIALFAAPAMLSLPVTRSLNPLDIRFILGTLTVLFIFGFSFFFTPCKKLYLKLFQLGKDILAVIANFIRNDSLVLSTNVLLSVLRVVATGASYYYCLYALHIAVEDQFFIIVTYAITAGLIAYIPVSFNGLGTVEAFAMLLFGLLGVTPAEVISMYLILRTFGIVTAWLPLLLLKSNLKPSHT